MRVILFVFLFSCFGVHSQVIEQTIPRGDQYAPEVRWGELEKVDRKRYGKEIAHESDKYLYVFENLNTDIDLLLFRIPRDAGMILNVYDKGSLSKVHSQQIKYPINKDDRYDYRFEKIIELGDKLYIILHALESRTKSLKLIAQEIDEMGKQKGEYYLLDEAASREGDNIFSKRKIGGFTTTVNREKNELLIIKDVALEDNDKKWVGIKKFDSNLKQVLKSRINFPYSDEYLDLRNFEFGPNNKIIFIARQWKTRETKGLTGKTITKIEKREEGVANYNYKCMIYDLNAQSEKVLDIAVADNYVLDVQLTYLPKDSSLYIAGFYSEQWGGSVRGSFIHVVDLNTDEFSSQKVKPFSKRFLQLFLSNRKIRQMEKGKKGDYELANFNLDKFVVREDGSSIMTAESYYVQQNSSTYRDYNGFLRTTINYTYHYDDIVVIQSDKNGKTQWSAKVPKRQLSYNDGGPFSSYLLNVSNENVSLIFNDNRKNLERLEEGESVRTMGNPKVAVLTHVVLDKKGNMNRKRLVSQEDLVFRPKSSWYNRDVYKNQRIYFFGLNYGTFKRTKYKLGEINFD